MKTYYNTTNLTGSELNKSEKTASKQEDRILKYFEEHPRENIAAHEIHQAILEDVPLTSVRRGMTNLCDAMLIIKTDYRVTGPYGKKVYTWRLKPTEPVMCFF